MPTVHTPQSVNGEGEAGTRHQPSRLPPAQAPPSSTPFSGALAAVAPAPGRKCRRAAASWAPPFTAPRHPGSRALLGHKARGAESDTCHTAMSGVGHQEQFKTELPLKKQIQGIHLTKNRPPTPFQAHGEDAAWLIIRQG